MHTLQAITQLFENHNLTNLPETLVVLGSGWNAILRDIEIKQSVPYDQLFGTTSSVPGHQGRLVIGTLKNKEVLFMAGRFHTYEGYSTEEVTRPLQAMTQFGVKRVLLTAAAGALNESYQVGDLVVASDVITAFCPSPLTGPHFVNMFQPFSEEWSQKVKSVCEQLQYPFQTGVYCYTRGPHFETAADKRLFQKLGADVIGMSTVPEVIMAKYLGLDVLSLSLVTNLAFVKHDHQEVLQAAVDRQEKLNQILQEMI